MYTAEEIQRHVRLNESVLFASYAVGRPEGWIADQRTKDLICLSVYVREVLHYFVTIMVITDEERRLQEAAFNRKSRAEEDLFALAALLLSDAQVGRINRYRGR